MKKDFQKNPIVKFLSSIKITVACLLWLFILTFWGTVSQVDLGLYVSQEKFFHSWYFLAFDFLPLPGGQLVLWILFVNLLLNAFLRFVYRWSHAGIVVIHIGLLLYFISAFVTFHVVEESNLTLLEGEGSNLSVSYHDWEMSMWTETEGAERTVYAFDTNHLSVGEVVHLDVFSKDQRSFDFVAKAYYPNAQAFQSQEDPESTPLNQSGITRIAPKKNEIELEKNVPGVIFEIRVADQSLGEVLLYGAESNPTRLKILDETINFQLRRKRYPLPIFVHLDKFKMEVHPGTETAKSYESEVTFTHKKVQSQARIYMNHPLRFGAYTFYQAAYSIDEEGRKRSTLAVVKNVGRWLPYITSIITFIGLALHFIVVGFSRRKRT